MHLRHFAYQIQHVLPASHKTMGRTHFKFSSDLFTFRAAANVPAPLSFIPLPLRLY